MAKNKIINALLLFTFLGQTTISQNKEKLKLNIGGAIRFNYNLSDWKEEQVKGCGDYGYDVFRLNTSGSYKKTGFNAEYRFYSRGVKIQALSFNKNPNDLTQYQDVIEMATFGAPYQVAADGQILTYPISYKIAIKGDLVDQRFCSGDCRRR